VMGTSLGVWRDGRLTKEVSGGEVLGRRVRTDERSEEQPGVPARGPREFTVSVWRSGRCQGVRRGTRATIHGGSTTASVAAQLRRRGRGGRRVDPRGGGVLLL
jgi:hypothetical protein